MPEMPEVESLARWLTQRTAGLQFTRLDVLAISALRTYDPPIDALKGQTIDRWHRRGKFLIASTAASGAASTAASTTDGLHLCIHLARAGWIRWTDTQATGPAKLTKGPQALRVTLSDGSGFTATEAGTDKRLSVHVVRDPNDVEYIRTLGIEAISPEFTVRRLGEILAEQGGSRIKGVLTEQGVIAGIGNAYSDEALHVARLSPYASAATLAANGPALEALHDAIVRVLHEALERSSGKPVAELKDAKRTGMRVHGRTGLPCPECGDAVREVAFASKSWQYCATCQTDGKALADRRMSRLLK
jgi:formamidopyrimidine-DNA glycosylase